MEVFLVQHVHTINEDEEDIKIIGIYSSEENACTAINRVKTQLGFKEFPDLIEPLTDDRTDGFFINKYSINEDHWSEGFITE